MITKVNLLKIPLSFYEESDILEYFEKDILGQNGFAQVISINTENFVLATQNKEFNDLVRSSQIHILDGGGVVLAVKSLCGVALPRLTGIDLMNCLVHYACQKSFRILLIGGKSNLADLVKECYKKKHLNLKIWASQGFLNIDQPKNSEIQALKTIVSSVRPHFVFVAFGSPKQELWIEQNRAWFKGSLVMGVGGAFEFVVNPKLRAPLFMQRNGLEWLYRLFKQPWRIGRQLRIVQFLILIGLQKIKQFFNQS